MDKFNDFFLSVLLHAVAALIVVIFSLIAPTPKTIAPNRIRILEIDLKNVKITGLETILKNAEKDAGAERDKTKNSKAEATQKPAPVMQTIKVNRETADYGAVMRAMGGLRDAGFDSVSLQTRTD